MGGSVLGLDVGEKRVGVALLRSSPRIPVALSTLERDSKYFWQQLKDLIDEYQIDKIVVGLPRGLNGQETAQTEATKVFAQELQVHITLPLVWQDESLTSVAAEAALKATGKPYDKGDIDATAAQLILSDYLEHETV